MEGVPGEYTYRLQYIEKGLTSAEGQQYIQFVEETGAKQVATWFRWVSFCKKTDDGSFELFSDIDSRLKHIGSLLYFFGVLSLCDIMILVSTISNLITFTEPRQLPALAIIFLSTSLVFSAFLRLWFGKRKLIKIRFLHD